MPEIRQLTNLFESLARQDLDAAQIIASQIADHEESKGHRTAAAKLKGALRGIGANGNVASPLVASSGGFLLSRALQKCRIEHSLDELTFRPLVRASLNEVVSEWKARDELRRLGIPRRTRLLFHGPPGCGKTATALAMAGAFGVPAYVVRFDTLIGSYLGQTALNLREVFRFAASTKCVLLLDEIDVVGKRRGSQMDVGELDRIVVSLMQELDFSTPAGLVIGASNLASHLDDALWRRFDLRLKFPAPTTQELHAYAKRLAANHTVSVSRALTVALGKARDYASARSLIVDQVRQRIVKKHLADET